MGRRWGGEVALTSAPDGDRLTAVWADTERGQGALPPDDARACKKRHPHAVRILAWLRVIWSCRSDGTCYDPVTHQANNKIEATQETALAP